MNKFSIKSQTEWRQAYGNSTGVWSSAALEDTGRGSGSASNSGSGSHSDGGISKAVAGVIGAVVTLAVILAVELVILLSVDSELSVRRGLLGRSDWHSRQLERARPETKFPSTWYKMEGRRGTIPTCTRYSEVSVMLNARTPGRAVHETPKLKLPWTGVNGTALSKWFGPSDKFPAGNFSPAFK
jgi:hypothetical protein